LFIKKFRNLEINKMIIVLKGIIKLERRFLKIASDAS
jgi:hypothetical protein